MATKIDMPKWRREVLAAMQVVASSRDALEKAEADLKQAEADLERLGGGDSITADDVTGASRDRFYVCDGRPPVNGEDGGKCTNRVRRASYEDELKPTEQAICYECRSAIQREAKAKGVPAPVEADPIAVF